MLVGFSRGELVLVYHLGIKRENASLSEGLLDMVWTEALINGG